MKPLMIALAATLLSGCASHEMYVLRNPKTNEIKECGGEKEGFSLFPVLQANAHNTKARDCSNGYQAAGWELMSNDVKK